MTEKQAWAVKVASGQAEGLRIPLSRAVPPGRHVGLAEVNWAACMASSRALANPDGHMCEKHMKPLALGLCSVPEPVYSWFCGTVVFAQTDRMCGCVCRYLIPIIDLANHKEDSPHTVRWEVSRGSPDSGEETTTVTDRASVSLQLVAGSDMAQGEEVRCNERVSPIYLCLHIRIPSCL